MPLDQSALGKIDIRQEGPMGRARTIVIASVVCALAVTVGLAAGCGGGSVPKIDSVTPNSGEPGSEVTLGGEMFGEAQGESTVGFGTVTASVKEWSDGSIMITVPDALGPGGYKVSVTTEDGTSNDVDFTVTERPAPYPTHTAAPTATATPTPTPSPTLSP